VRTWDLDDPYQRVWSYIEVWEEHNSWVSSDKRVLELKERLYKVKKEYLDFWKPYNEVYCVKCVKTCCTSVCGFISPEEISVLNEREWQEFSKFYSIEEIKKSLHYSLCPFLNSESGCLLSNNLRPIVCLRHFCDTFRSALQRDNVYGEAMVIGDRLGWIRREVRRLVNKIREERGMIRLDWW